MPNNFRVSKLYKPANRLSKTDIEATIELDELSKQIQFFVAHKLKTEDLFIRKRLLLASLKKYGINDLQRMLWM